MRLFRSRLFFALVGVILISVGLLGLRFALIMRDLAALQRTFNGQLELHLRRPEWVTYYVELAVCNLFARKGSNAERGEVLQRFYILCGVRVTAMRLRIDSSKGDTGAALQGMPQLEAVSVYMNPHSTLTEAEATKICTGLRALPELAQLELLGSAFTDTAIAPLAGHPAIWSIGIGGSVLSRHSIPTLVSLPSLKSMILPADERLVPDSEFEAIKAALPRVKIKEF